MATRLCVADFYVLQIRGYMSIHDCSVVGSNV